MFGQLFKGIQLLHFALLAVSAAGFFIYWARTRFWLPKYPHILAAIGLVVGLACVANMPADAPLNREGPILRFLSALVLPAMVYFFFVFYGGQHAAIRRRFKISTPCPHCGLQVIAFRTGGGAADPISSYDKPECLHTRPICQFSSKLQTRGPSATCRADSCGHSFTTLFTLRAKVPSPTLGRAMHRQGLIHARTVQVEYYFKRPVIRVYVHLRVELVL
jgi:hypothetical protein